MSGPSLILMLSSLVIGEEIFKPTGRYAPVQLPIIDPAKPPEQAKTVQRYLVSEPWCGLCPAAKSKFLAEGNPEVNIITMDECQRRFGFRPQGVPYRFESSAEIQIRPKEGPPTAKPKPPVRYIQWPGWGQIDLQTYNRNCNCNMCRTIRAKQQQYQQQLRAYQQATTSVLPDDQQPCPDEVVAAMLDAMQLGPQDTLADLGCGDGRILIAAARRGIRGIGVELDPSRVHVARQKVIDSGLSHMITIDDPGDARNFDPTRATAITAYLYPTLLAELAPKLRQVRVAASPFHEVPGIGMTKHGDVWIYKRNQSATVAEGS